ncbi:MAG: hypothetical protein GC181_15335 [Bacteroidetes bacterium]|nr:hypothetical protein [Bacteroidota bacterium]
MGIFLVVFAMYFFPQLEGKVVNQGDIVSGIGMTKEVEDYYEKTGIYSLWTDAMFGGMPTYQISAPQNSNLIRKYVEKAFQLFIKAPISWFFVAAMCFYILMLVMGVDRWLAIVGGLAFALSTNSLLLYAAGHTSKFRAISYIPLILAGVYLLLQKKEYIKGSVCFLIGMALNLSANHFQMTYYLVIGMFFFMLVYLVFAIKNGELIGYLKSAGIMIVAAVLAAGPSSSKLFTTKEYAEDTMRGESELKVEENARNNNVKTAGLTWDYSMMWSNAPRDFLGIFIPGAVGGSSQQYVKEDWESAKYFNRNGNEGRAPMYWGGGDSTDGPMYFGAIIFFLFVLGVVVLPHNGFKYAVIAAFFVVMLLSLGRYFESFNRIFFNYLPKYDSFRAHNSAISVVSAFFPVLSIYGLWYFFNSGDSEEKKINALKIAGGITLGLTILFGFMGGIFFDFEHFKDASLQRMYQIQDSRMFDDLMSAIMDDRKTMLRSSAIRTLIFTLIGAGTLWFWVKKKLKMQHAILIIGIVAVGDLFLLDKNYFNEKDFVQEREIKNQHKPREVDMAIMQNEPMGRGYYRVLDLSINTFQSSYASYFHNTVGGYSAVKLQRIQDIIDSSFSRTIPFNILNMLNTKYIIESKRDPNNPQQSVQGESIYPNPDAIGTAWFVDSIQMVNTATEELKKLDSFNPTTTAIIHNEFSKYFNDFNLNPRDSNSTATIQLTKYTPNKLTYKVNSDKPRLVVFSEIWYGPNKGWVSTVNGKEQEHIRADYLLRAMKVPAGESEIVFEFKPQSYKNGERVSLASSILILLIFFGWAYTELKKLMAEPAK